MSTHCDECSTLERIREIAATLPADDIDGLIAYAEFLLHRRKALDGKEPCGLSARAFSRRTPDGKEPA